jgi:hypothetical protein
MLMLVFMGVKISRQGMLTAALKLLLMLPTNTTDFVIDLLLAFGAGCGATLGYQLGQRMRAEAKKSLKRDTAAELVYWVLPPVVGAFAGVGMPPSP